MKVLLTCFMALMLMPAQPDSLARTATPTPAEELQLQADTLSAPEQKHAYYEFVSGDIGYVTSYVYRGMKITDHFAYALLKLHYKGLSFAAEYGSAFNGQYMEVVLDVGYTYKGFSVRLRDQYFPYYQGVKSLGYFNWKPEESSHQLEVLFEYKAQKVPINVLWSTYVAGYDLRYEFDQQGNFSWGDRAFSSYLEMTAYHRFPRMYTVAGTLGFSVNRGLYTAYQADFALVNTRLSFTKTWDCKYVYPTIGAFCVMNPYLGKFYPVALFSLAF